MAILEMLFEALLLFQMLYDTAGGRS